MAEINLIPDYMKLSKDKRSRSKFSILILTLSCAVVLLIFVIPAYAINRLEKDINYLHLKANSSTQFNDSIVNDEEIINMKKYIKTVDAIKNDRVILSAMFNDLVVLLPKDIEILDLQANSKSVVLNCRTNNFDSIIEFTNLIQKSMEGNTVSLESINANQLQENYLLRMKIEFKRGN